MNYRILGKTGLRVSEVGFGAWGIGGPSMAGSTPIGWGEVDDNESVKALNKAFELGINFYDTADFYGLGHSEELIGSVFNKRRNEIVIATKVGHKLAEDNSILLDYSKDYILSACEQSLKRLNTEYIDVYQLHSARINHLQNGECIEAMEKLKQEGKIRYWGISLNTFTPEAEAEFFIKNNIGYTFQLVLNIINQHALEKTIGLAAGADYGIIARMPLQFGLLTGKFTKDKRFSKNDHRNFRLPPDVLSQSIDRLEWLWEISEKYNISKTSFAMSFILSHPEISTVIPGIKTDVQAIENTKDIVNLNDEDIKALYDYYKSDLKKLLELYV